MSNEEKYKDVLLEAKKRGFEKRISVGNLRNMIATQFTIHQQSALKFHMQMMESMGFIKQCEYPGVWEIVDRDKKQEVSENGTKTENMDGVLAPRVPHSPVPEMPASRIHF
jgi:hypothetical protein